MEWNKIGRVLAGVADQLGIEVPGVDVGPVTDAIAEATEVVAGQVQP